LNFFLSFLVVTIWLGVYLPRMALGNGSIAVMALWTVWLVVLPVVIEFCDVVCKRRISAGTTVELVY
jgi:hypothetical protein